MRKTRGSVAVHAKNSKYSTPIFELKKLKLSQMTGNARIISGIHHVQTMQLKNEVRMKNASRSE